VFHLPLLSPDLPDAREVRKIIHIDMDAFFAAVEQRDNPGLRGRPVAVGGSGERGVVAAASYEARRFGVRSAMSSVVARRRCPDLVFVEPRFDVYKSISRQVRSILADYTALIEPLSLDEAYLDVTINLKGIPSATRTAQEIRARIREQTQLTASAGVSYNKFLAKLASDQNKPDGLYVIAPGEGAAFVEGLPVDKFYGVGPVTAAKMRRLGILTGLDLRAKPKEFLREHFGSAGDYYYEAARGVDHRPVDPNEERKSVGSESTFARDLMVYADLVTGLQPAIDAVWEHCTRAGIAGRTVTLKVKYNNFRQVTRSRTCAEPVADRASVERVGLDLLSTLLPLRRGVRLLGLTLSNLTSERVTTEQQLPLFEQHGTAPHGSGGQGSIDHLSPAR
jgi:DNA polymerase-4